VVGSFFAALGADERVAEVSFTDSSLSVALKDLTNHYCAAYVVPHIARGTLQQSTNWEVAGGGTAFTGPNSTKT
jgi:hypothetical protein